MHQLAGCDRVRGNRIPHPPDVVGLQHRAEERVVHPHALVANSRLRECGARCKVARGDGDRLAFVGAPEHRHREQQSDEAGDDHHQVAGREAAQQAARERSDGPG
jgi:hypothetical protein